ncbi:MAG: helix-turn-helix domain-containing protein [Aliarcobacter sp.]|nr:helix-turn-helix domain-containing protein [Aliarcobacter sp.]
MEIYTICKSMSRGIKHFMRNTEEIINSLKEILNLKNDIELAQYLNISAGAIPNWKARNKIPYEEIFTICELKRIDPNYVFYGKKNEILKENINFKEKIIENLDKLNDKELKYFYHWTSSEIAKKEL